MNIYSIRVRWLVRSKTNKALFNSDMVDEYYFLASTASAAVEKVKHRTCSDFGLSISIYKKRPVIGSVTFIGCVER